MEKTLVMAWRLESFSGGVFGFGQNELQNAKGKLKILESFLITL
jgi:hypothetical protein